MSISITPRKTLTSFFIAAVNIALHSTDLGCYSGLFDQSIKGVTAMGSHKVIGCGRRERRVVLGGRVYLLLQQYRCKLLTDCVCVFVCG